MVDLPSFSLGLICSIAVSYLLLWAVLHRLEREPGFWALQLASLAGTASVILVILQGRVWPFLPYVLGNTLAVLSVTLFWQGFRQWMTGEDIPKAAWILPFFTPFLGFWYGLIEPDIRIRIIALNLLILFPSGAMARLLWKQAAHSAAPNTLRLLSATTGFVGLMAILRTTNAMTLDLAEARLLTLSWHHALPYLAQIIGLVAFVTLTTMALISGLVTKLRIQAQHDALTELRNRIGLRAAIADRLRDAGAQRANCSLLMLDLDHFKQVNDQFGHDQGDAVLRHLAAVMREQAAPLDIPARLGGEEFMLLSFSSDPLAQAEAIREQFGKGADGLPPCTVSIGLVSHFPFSAAKLRDAFRRADDALYQAKNRGRNRTEQAELGEADAA